MAVENIQTGLRSIGHECDVTFDDPRRDLDQCEFVLLHGFEEARSQEYAAVLEDLRRRGVPHAILAHDYWPICHQTNLCVPSRGWLRCEGPAKCIGEECHGRLSPMCPPLPKDETFVCFCETAAQHFRREGYATKVIPHGIDLRIFRPAVERTAGQPLRVLFADAWGEKEVKGYRHWKWLKERTADEFDCTAVLGEIPHERMPHFYVAGDCFLFLSLWDETFGLVLAEAMACGLPVISYPVGIAPTAINDRVNGRLIGTNSPEDVLVALREFAALAAEERAEMGRQSRQTAVELFSLERMAEAYVELAGCILR